MLYNLYLHRIYNNSFETKEIVSDYCMKFFEVLTFLYNDSNYFLLIYIFLLFFLSAENTKKVLVDFSLSLAICLCTNFNYLKLTFFDLKIIEFFSFIICIYNKKFSNNLQKSIYYILFFIILQLYFLKSYSENFLLTTDTVTNFINYVVFNFVNDIRSKICNNGIISLRINKNELRVFFKVYRVFFFFYTFLWFFHSL